MREYRRGHSKKYNLITFMLTIIVIGLICGVIYYLKLPKVTKTLINNNLSSMNIVHNYNNIIVHLIIISIICLFSFFIVGLPLAFFYLFYEGLSIGFNIVVFWQLKKIRGLFYAIIYNLVYKLIYLLLLFLFIFKMIDIIYNILRYLFYQKNDRIKIIIFNKVKVLLFIVILIIINDILIYFFGNYILNLFKFLL